MKSKSAMANGRFWLLMWGLGLAGQLCWNIENQWFNTFIYAKIAKDSSIVTLMVITSALVTTISTFLFGTLSDRKGTRRRYIAFGYIAWGVFTILFGLTEFIGGGTVGAGAKVSVLAAVLVILADDVMSFFGSMGNDSGYNAWSNDNTTPQNRGQVGAALAILPVVGTIVGTVLGGLLIGANDNYQRLFWAMGLFVIASGLLALFFLRDAPGLAPAPQQPIGKQLAETFRLQGFFSFSRPELALACLATALFYTPFNIYFAHMGNWMIYRMGFTADSMGLVQGLSLLLACLLVVPAIVLINKNKTPLVAAAAILVNLAGLWVLTLFIRPETVNTASVFSAANLPLFLAVFLVGAGHVLMTQSMNIWVKQLFPPESRGRFEGVRVLFFVLIPMLIGSLIGNAIVKNGAGSVVNDYGITENIPTESIYLYAGIMVLATFVPLFFAARRYYARVRANAQEPQVDDA